MKVYDKTCRVEKYFSRIIESDRVVLFGCGGKGRQAVSLFKSVGVQITDCCDNNEALWGKEFINGMKICNPREVINDKEKYSILLTCSMNNALDIVDTLKKYCGDNVELFHFCNPFKVEEELLSSDCYDGNQEKINSIFSIISEEKSKMIFKDMIFYKCTGNFFPMLKYLENDNTCYTFFDEKMFNISEENVYVDIGAYTGDTIESFVIWSRGKYKKIIGYEADEGNFGALGDFVRYSRINNIEIKNETLWSEICKKKWFTCENGNIANYDSPNLYKSIEQIADNNTLNSNTNNEKNIWTTTLDDSLQNENVSIIKINALAADHQIIMGATSIIRRNHPCLIMEYGVTTNDVFSLILDIYSISDNYNFFFRVKKIFSDIKIILYCISK